ncbi:dTDP-4-dehydrorhamnose 3,5-epimerase [Murinocardiopsis flavida]|uniref:dTDP-4-dehydrorhamnose 3,5-epimerase n=1 Tax=Murinocardiopsis flavida TaxID=645275 RepID=A0A2P8DTI9_9ACTN|nr:dTDP-4-dehydrorhamnose 3,5-epimerase family protein [Murinocardiopsis flavida]PSL00536.1 dTDP-4-dehydrorhamnose 3,5-epimerase [Murinocardiopsis flavida]
MPQQISEIEELAVSGTYLLKPRLFPDDRGMFLVPFTQPEFKAATGRPLEIAQVNTSLTRRGVIRGLHVVSLPGQGRYFNCAHGAIQHIVVDTRVGSPTFGRYTSVELSAENRFALFVSEGLAAGFTSITDDATVWYMCTSLYEPNDTVIINPMDGDLDLPWPGDDFVLSDQDRTAPTLKEAAELELLPSYADCRARYAELGGDRTSAVRS